MYEAFTSLLQALANLRNHCAYNLLKKGSILFFLEDCVKVLSAIKLNELAMNMEVKKI